MSAGAMRRRCERRLRELPLPDPFDLHTFRRQLEGIRGRPLRLRAVPVPISAPSGVWVPVGTEDFIFVDAACGPAMYEHVVLHELMHIMCGHEPVAAWADEYLRALLPDFDSEFVRQKVLALPRRGYDSPPEREAELLATMIGSRVRRMPARTTPTSAQPAWDRCRVTLAHQ